MMMMMMSAGIRVRGSRCPGGANVLNSGRDEAARRSRVQKVPAAAAGAARLDVAAVGMRSVKERGKTCAGRDRGTGMPSPGPDRPPAGGRALHAGSQPIIHSCILMER